MENKEENEKLRLNFLSDKARIQEIFGQTDFDKPDSVSSFLEQIQEETGANYWRDEARKAFKDRDAAKNRIKELSALTSKKLESIKKNSNRSVSDSKLLEFEIISQAKKCKAYTPKQIYSLLKDSFIMDESGGYYSPIHDAKGNEIGRKSVADVVAEYLSDPQNDNLVESSMKGGSGHGETPGKSLLTSGSGRRVKADNERKSRNKFSEKILKEADERGLSPKDWSDILEAKKKILAKRGK